MKLSNDVENYEIEVTKNGSKLLIFSYGVIFAAKAVLLN